MQPTYRNQTTNLQRMQLLSQLKVTNRTDAIALLKVLGPLFDQIAAVMQRDNLNDISRANRVATPAPAPVQTESKPVEVVPTELVAEDIEEHETFTEEEIKDRVATLKKSKKTK